MDRRAALRLPENQFRRTLSPHPRAMPVNRRLPLFDETDYVATGASFAEHRWRRHHSEHFLEAARCQRGGGWGSFGDVVPKRQLRCVVGHQFQFGFGLRGSRLDAPLDPKLRYDSFCDALHSGVRIDLDMRNGRLDLFRSR